jgi:hypothetical protein
MLMLRGELSFCVVITLLSFSFVESVGLVGCVGLLGWQFASDAG